LIWHGKDYGRCHFSQCFPDMKVNIASKREKSNQFIPLTTDIKSEERSAANAIFKPRPTKS